MQKILGTQINEGQIKRLINFHQKDQEDVNLKRNILRRIKKYFINNNFLIVQNIKTIIIIYILMVQVILFIDV